jgi:phosphoadenosine phosphosulfate reductase
MNRLFDVVKRAARLTDSVIVEFSTGRESVCCADLCFKFFKKIHLIFLYVVPDLSYEQEIIEYYTKRYNCECTQAPITDTLRFQRDGIWRKPNPDVTVIPQNEIRDFIITQTGIGWIVNGMRMAESIHRRGMINARGAIDEEYGLIFPLADWNLNQTKQYVKNNKLRLSPSYKTIGRSICLLNPKHRLWIQKNRPDDYRKILEFFPRIDLETEIIRELNDKGVT